jgi:hypothetical protein
VIVSGGKPPLTSQAGTPMDPQTAFLKPPRSSSARAAAAASVALDEVLEQRIAKEPDAVAVTFADPVPGASFPIGRTASVEIPSGAGPAFETGFATSSVGPGFFEAFGRSI